MVICCEGGEDFEIDASDLPFAMAHKWHLRKGYPSAVAYFRGRKRLMPYHWMLLGSAPRGFQWDHEDRNKLNNQRSNLRAVIPLRNCLNRDAVEFARNIVRRSRRAKCGSREWHVHISIQGRQRCYGSWGDLEVAKQWAHAYKVMANREWDSYEALEINRIATIRLRRLPLCSI